MFSSVILLIYCSLCKRLLISNITDILFRFVNVFSSVILLIYCSVLKTCFHQLYYWYTYKTVQYISNITDEKTFTKLNSKSAILLMRTRLQSWIVYQLYFCWKHVYKSEQYISNITDEKTFQLCKRILISNIADNTVQFCKRLLISNITDILFSFEKVFSSVILLIYCSVL
jgi:hypothetical protein